jgi:hypothetical protein
MSTSRGSPGLGRRDPPAGRRRFFVSKSNCGACRLGGGVRAKRTGSLLRAAPALVWLSLLTPAGWLAAPTAQAQARAKAPAQAQAKPTVQPTVQPKAQAPNPIFVAAVEEQKAADSDAKNVQNRIDQIDDETARLLGEYRQYKSETESFDAYSKQLATQIQSQVDEIARTNAEMAEIETTTREVLPMMQNMLDTLARFVELDVPFLLNERSKRVATLKEMMTRADVSVSEKYRRIVEAYVVEMEYGRTIEAYEDKLGGGDERTVQLLRIGRVTLLYQTMDGKETGYWDNDKKAWVVNNDYQHAFREGVHVAKKMGAPDILLAPIQAPKEDS